MTKTKNISQFNFLLFQKAKKKQIQIRKKTNAARVEPRKQIKKIKIRNPDNSQKTNPNPDPEFLGYHSWIQPVTNGESLFLLLSLSIFFCFSFPISPFLLPPLILSVYASFLHISLRFLRVFSDLLSPPLRSSPFKLFGSRFSSFLCRSHAYQVPESRSQKLYRVIWAALLHLKLCFADIWSSIALYGSKLKVDILLFHRLSRVANLENIFGEKAHTLLLLVEIFLHPCW